MDWRRWHCYGAHTNPIDVRRGSPSHETGTGTARLLLLVNYRPEYQHGWSHKTYYTQLRLDPLQPVNAEVLLHILLGDDTGLEPLKSRLIERTQGNPFFLEESVR
jgi:predicted ATPase